MVGEWWLICMYFELKKLENLNKIKSTQTSNALWKLSSSRAPASTYKKYHLHDPPVFTSSQPSPSPSPSWSPHLCSPVFLPLLSWRPAHPAHSHLCLFSPMCVIDEMVISILVPAMKWENLDTTATLAAASTSSVEPPPLQSGDRIVRSRISRLLLIEHGFRDKIVDVTSAGPLFTHPSAHCGQIIFTVSLCRCKACAVFCREFRSG